MQENLKKENHEINPDLKRIDRHYITHEIGHLLHLDRGFFFTIKELFLRPGKTIRSFVFQDRKKLVKPILFLIFCSVIFSVIVHLLHAEVSLFNIDRIAPLQNKIRSEEIGGWINNNLGYSQLLMGIFIAPWLKIFFKKKGYNIYEIVILLSYIFGEALLILISFVLVANLFDSNITASIGVVAYFIYLTWGIGQFFGERKIINYVKSALSYIIGLATYLATLILIAYLLKILL